MSASAKVLIVAFIVWMAGSVTMCTLEVRKDIVRETTCRDACYPTVAQSGRRFCACADGRILPHEVSP